MDGAAFALYGLLLAFTFSGAPARLDVRRQLIAEETNAIGTAYMRIDLLSPEAQPAMRQRFRDYLDSRLAVYRSLPDIDAAQAELERSAELQREIWTAAIIDTNGSPNAHPNAPMLMLPAISAMAEVANKRTMSALIHPPPVIFLLLFLIALVVAGLAGYGMAADSFRSWLHILAFAGIASITVFMVLEIEFPRTGLIGIRKYDQMLLELRQSMQ